MEHWDATRSTQSSIQSRNAASARSPPSKFQRNPNWRFAHARHRHDHTAFSWYREDYLDDEGFTELQLSLASSPEAGDLIPGAGGIRKLRWKDPRRKKGKRGGLRVIYYCFLSDEEIWLLTLYDKDEAAHLTKDQKDQLRRALEAERAARKGDEKK